MKRILLGTAVSVAASCWAAPAAYAQSATVLVDTAIPDNFDRDRNISVLERPHPDYDPLDIRTGGFIISPQIETGGGATDNVYLTHDNTKSDVYLYTAPSVIARSDWSGSQVMLSAAGLGRRYLDEARRNETSYNLRALGEKDLGPHYSITGEAQYAKLYESPDSGAVDSALAVLSSYQRSYFNLRGQYSAGRGRVIVALDRTAFTFNDIHLSTGDIDQSNRDRVVSRVTTEVQYALSPSVSLYTQGSLDDTNYSERLAGGDPNRDSTGYRLVGGLNFDLAGLVRGKIGLGYTQRDYHSPAYRDVGGVSVEALVEYFPTDLTTVGLRLGRTIEDASISNTSAYWQNRAQLRVDHELLNNLVLSAIGEYTRQSYIDSVTPGNKYYRVSGLGRYLASRFVTLNASVSYLRRTADNTPTANYNEFRGQIGITFRR